MKGGGQRKLVDIKKIFTSADGKIVVNVPYLEIYIPMSYFDKSGNLAQDNGETIRCIACLPIGIFENDKFVEYRTLKLSETMDLYVYDSDVENKQLPGMPSAAPVKILKYFQGQELMADFVIQNSLNVQKYLDLILKGKLPGTLRYDYAMMLWNKNLEINSISLGVQATNRELILSVQYRDKDTPSKTLAEKLNTDKNATMFDFVTANIRQVCQFTSTFTALTFEDFDSMVTSSLKRTKEKLYEPTSPLEQIIKM